MNPRIRIKYRPCRRIPGTIEPDARKFADLYVRLKKAGPKSLKFSAGVEIRINGRKASSRSLVIRINKNPGRKKKQR